MFTKENQHTLSQKNHLSICHANMFYPPPPPPPPPNKYNYLYFVRIPRFPRFISIIFV